jgi:hypothetical protein
MLALHLWQVEACEGNACAAALLSFFQYWHEIRLALRVKAQQANAVAEKHGDEGTQDVSLWQHHTQEEIEAGIFIYKRDTIAAGVVYLAKKGFLQVGKNPNPRYKFDRTSHYLFNVENVAKWLSDRTTEKQQSSPENRSPSPINPAPEPKNPPAIPEIQPEILSETKESPAPATQKEKPSKK